MLASLKGEITILTDSGQYPIYIRICLLAVNLNIYQILAVNSN